MFFRGLKNKVVIAACVLAVIVIALTFVLKGRNNSDGNYSKPNLPDIQFGDDNGYSLPKQDDTVKIQAVTGLKVKSDTLTQKLNISNPSSNKYVFVVEIYLGDGTRLYVSDYIFPSNTITDVIFDITLKSGVYKNALMIYTCCTIDDQHIPLTRYEFPIEIWSSTE